LSYDLLDEEEAVVWGVHIDHLRDIAGIEMECNVLNKRGDLKFLVVGGSKHSG
jgi:hypothetical protein